MASGAADLDERIAPMLADLGLDVGPDALMTSLSGGQAARAALAALLLSRFDVVLLDEPTNDLDLAGLERLEAFVRGLRSGVVLVSHDREFLARCVTRIVELDLAQNQVSVYDGGYDAFLEERAVARRHAREAYDEFAEKKADLVARARTQREWSSQGVRNAMKKSPDNDKIRRKAASESSEKQAQKVRQMESRIARLEEVEEPRKEWVLQFSIGAAPRSSAVVATLNEATVRRGDFRLGPASLQVNARDRIGITGPNGAGKTTLIRLLLGRDRPDTGTASLGASVAIGEIDQARTGLAEDLPLGDAVEAALPELAPADVRTLLAKFGLKADQVASPVGRLSPGERTRAALALLQGRGVNLLVLDEPTNHLDLPAIEQLEEALDSYDGALLLVSHDRRLLDNVSLDRRWRVEGGVVTEELTWHHGSRETAGRRAPRREPRQRRAHLAGVRRRTRRRRRGAGVRRPADRRRAPGLRARPRPAAYRQQPRRWSPPWSSPSWTELDFAAWKNPWADLDDEAPDPRRASWTGC